MVLNWSLSFRHLWKFSFVPYLLRARSTGGTSRPSMLTITRGAFVSMLALRFSAPREVVASVTPSFVGEKSGILYYVENAGTHELSLPREDSVPVSASYSLRTQGFDGPVVDSSTVGFLIGDGTVNDAMDELSRSLAVGATRRATVPAAFDLDRSGVKTAPTYLEFSLSKVRATRGCAAPTAPGEPFVCNAARSSRPGVPYLHRRGLLSRLRGGGFSSAPPRALTFEIVANVGDASPRDALEQCSFVKLAGLAAAEPRPRCSPAPSPRRHPLHASLTTPYRHWLDYTWDAGGGLPAIALPLAKDAGGSLGFGEGRVAERLIFPSAVRERLLQVDRVTCAVEQHVEQRTTLASCGGLLRRMAAHSGCAAAPLRAQS